MQKIEKVLFPLYPGGSGAPALSVTASGSSPAYPDFAQYESAIILVNVSAVTGTTPQLQLQLDEWDPFSQLWIPNVVGLGTYTAVSPNPAKYMLGAGTGMTKTEGTAPNAALIGEQYRLTWTVSGTSPSFTFTCGALLCTGEPPFRV